MSAGTEARPTPPAPAPGTAEAPAAKGRSRVLALRYAGSAVLLLGAAFAYRELLLLRPGSSLAVPLSTEVESWFFEPSDTSPGLVLLFVAWLLYRRWGRLRRVLGQPGGWAGSAALAAPATLVFYWAMRTGAYDLLAASLGFALLASAFAFGGRAALRIVALPIALLVFAMPLPSSLLNEIVWRMQLWTAEYTGFLLHLLGQPALVSGDQILQPEQVFQIIETCSGTRAVETLTMLSVLMVDLFRRRSWHAALLIAAAPLVGFGINGFRALGLIFNPHAGVAAVHSAQGILMLLGGVLVLYGLDGLLERVMPTPPRAPAAAPAGPGPGLGARWTAAASLVALLLAMSWLRPWELPPRLARQPEEALPLVLGDWRGSDVETDRIFLGLAGFSHILHRSYARSGDRVDVFVASGTLARRHRSFRSPKTAIPGTGWIVEEREEKVLAGPEGLEGAASLAPDAARGAGQTVVERRVVRRGTRRMLVYHWRENTAGLAAEVLRDALALDASPLRRERIPVVVRLSAPVPPRDGGLAAAEAALARFAPLLEHPLKEIGTPRG